MAIALATLDANNITTETESDFADEFLSESSENLFLRNLSAIIANSERTSMRENQLSITEIPASPQPQLGYFLPISYTPKLRLKRFFPSHSTLNQLILMQDVFCPYLQRCQRVESLTNTTQPASQPPTAQHQQSHQQPFKALQLTAVQRLWVR